MICGGAPSDVGKTLMSATKRPRTSCASPHAFTTEPLILERGDDLSPIERHGVRQGAVLLTSTHPQSTCRMGADPKTSVVNAYGECHGVSGLFVADMSGFPTSLGAPPQITTAALADRTAHHILERWSELAG